MARVLVVDDSAFMRLSIKTILTMNGFEVVGEAENTRQAVERYKSLKPDLVTLDIIMPVESGIEALRRIIKVDPNAKVLMVSALGHDPIVQEAMRIGARGFVVKPFDANKLLGAIREFFTEKSGKDPDAGC